MEKHGSKRAESPPFIGKANSLQITVPKLRFRPGHAITDTQFWMVEPTRKWGLRGAQVPRTCLLCLGVADGHMLAAAAPEQSACYLAIFALQTWSVPCAFNHSVDLGLNVEACH